MSRGPETRRLSIWWPALAIERWTRIAKPLGDDRVALTVEVQQGQRIHAVTPAAALAGARPGMRLTDARALDPALKAVPADPEGDAALAMRLARWASRWSPAVEIDPNAVFGPGLRLDATGMAHLFGGEERLLVDIVERFAGLGLTARVAIAPTALAAWALARFGGGRTIAGKTRTAALLAPLPVAALGLAPDVTRVLERLGLKTVGSLAGIERRSLARRFREADNPLDALDRALGRRAEPIAPVVHQPAPRALLRLAEPVADPAAAPQSLDLMLPDLTRQLHERRLGVRRLVLAGYRVDGEVVVAIAACALPTRDATHLKRLLADKAAALDPGFGFDGFALEADWCEPLDSAQDGLAGGPPPEVEVARLIDRLSTKLGAEAVRRPQPRASHVPERASGWRRAVDKEAPSPARPPTAARPQRLLDRAEAIDVIYATPAGLPRRFVWRRAVHDVVLAEGPERIAPEWWRERSTARLRDYYKVEDRQGRRYWIYREGIHGDGRGGDPTWYLHGLFG
jgi:protein ImuB